MRTLIQKCEPHVTAASGGFDRLVFRGTLRASEAARGTE
jgi:hypothetical protein